MDNLKITQECIDVADKLKPLSDEFMNAHHSHNNKLCEDIMRNKILPFAKTQPLLVEMFFSVDMFKIALVIKGLEMKQPLDLMIAMTESAVTANSVSEVADLAQQAILYKQAKDALKDE